VYGYNTLLLSNDTAAILDLPTRSYLTDLQSQISADETINITASVNAYQASYNASTTALQTDDTLWSNILGLPVSPFGLNTIYTYQEGSPRLGFMPFNNNSQILFAKYYNTTYQGEPKTFYLEETPDEFDRFRKQAQIYSIKRAPCRGHWSVNTTSILLIDGSCETRPINSSILQMSQSYLDTSEILPVLGQMYEDFTNLPPDSAWLPATYAVSIATMYWARAKQQLHKDGIDLTYTPVEEKLVAMRHVLRAEALLYIVLSVQPVLTVLGFLVAVWLHKTPIGRNFGVVSILSGMDPTKLTLLRGAGLSGKLKHPVRLAVVTQPMQSDGPVNEERIQYNLELEPKLNKECDTEQKESSSLKRGWKYS
jgi:hypothetical protein